MFYSSNTVLVFLNNLWGLGTKYEKGYCAEGTLASGICSLESIPLLLMKNENEIENDFFSKRRKTIIFVPQLSKERRKTNLFVPKLSKERRQPQVFVPQPSKERRQSEVFVPQLSMI